MKTSVAYGVLAIIIVVVGGLYYWSQSKTKNSEIANPASVNCTNNGGALEFKQESGGQVGYCHLPDGRICEEWSFFHGGCENDTASTTEMLTADIYPIYKEAAWNPSKSEDVTVGEETYHGLSADSARMFADMKPGDVFSPFLKYYKDKLADAGWKEYNDLAAGGHTGGQEAYKKGDAIILVRYTINYHKVSANAPSECPCDVQLSLFSTK